MTFGPDPVGSILSHRGFKIEATGNYKDILIPWEMRIGISDNLLLASFDMFAKSSFRKFARHLTSHDRVSEIHELRKIAGDETSQYIEYLCDLGIAEVSDDRLTLNR